MTQPAPSLAEIAAHYQQAQQALGAPAAAAPAPSPGFAPQPAPSAPPQAPAGFYFASDGRLYPLPTATPAAPPPAAPAPQPAPQAQPQAQGFSVPPAQATQLAQQHAAQPLPINPPEAQQALLPEVQATPPAAKTKGGRKRTPAAQAAAGGDAEAELAGALETVKALLPKGCSVTIQGEGVA